MRSQYKLQSDFQVHVEGIGVMRYNASTQEEAYEIAERDTGRKAIRDPALEAKNAKAAFGRGTTAPPARTTESTEEVFARRERERATYEGPGPGEGSGSAKADSDFARRAAQTEAVKE